MSGDSRQVFRDVLRHDLKFWIEAHAEYYNCQNCPNRYRYPTLRLSPEPPEEARTH